MVGSGSLGSKGVLWGPLNANGVSHSLPTPSPPHNHITTAFEPPAYEPTLVLSQAPFRTACTECVWEPPGELPGQVQLLTQQVWGGARDPVFPTSCWWFKDHTQGG